MQIVFIYCLVVLAIAQHIPVVGVYTQDSNDYPGKTYIWSVGPRYLEVAGAKVVPIFYKSTEAELTNILSQINGVLFPGGNISFNMDNTWTKGANFILNYAMQQNDKGNVFPIYGICQGHQLLSYLTSGYDDNILQLVTKENPAITTLQFLNKSAYALQNWTSSLYSKVENVPGVLLQSHYWAVYKQYFDTHQKVNSFWHLIGISTTIAGNQTYTAMMQAKKYPFYTAQFHAQQNLFNTQTYQQLTNFQAIEVSQLLIMAFMQKVKQSPNRFISNDELQRSLIYNYPLTKFDQATRQKQEYVFDR